MDQDKSYLLRLYEGLEQQFENKQLVNFKIKEIKSSGFKVQVGGVYGLILFKDMPWSYKMSSHWKSLSPWIINKIMKGKIDTLAIAPDETHRISLTVDGSHHIFNEKPLVIGEDYQCVVLQKTDYGLFVDLGFHDSFKNGSFVGLIHRSSLDFQEDFLQLKEGNVFETTFFGFSEEGHLVLGDNKERVQWQLPVVTSLIGTTQDTVVRINDDGGVDLWVLGKYSARIENENTSEDEFVEDNELYANLEDEQVISCEILRINNFMNGFEVRIITE